MSDIENGTQESQESDEKQTNRVFTQSELDTKIALAEKRAKEEVSLQLTEFETTKQKLAELQQIENERKEAEMTETQKLQEQLKKYADEINPERFQLVLRKTGRASEAIFDEASKYDLIIIELNYYIDI